MSNLFFKEEENYIKTWHTTSPNYTSKKSKDTIFYPDSSIVFFASGLPNAEQSHVEHQSQIAVLMLPTINPKILDMLQDATFCNQSKTHLKQ
jgi:hypothetical protein